MSPIFPVALDLNGRRALVIGAHGEARGAALRLVDAGAQVTVIAPGEVDEALAEAAARDQLTLLRRPFEEADLHDQAIVFLAPGDDALSHRLHGALSAAGRLVCTLDRPELSSFSSMAVVNVPGLTIAFSSHGTSPGTLRRIREDLTTLFSDPRFAAYLEALRRLRASLPRGDARMARMRAAIQGFRIEARLHFPPWLAGPPAGPGP